MQCVYSGIVRAKVVLFLRFVLKKVNCFKGVSVFCSWGGIVHAENRIRDVL